MMPAKAVYRALLHCYPAAFRDEYTVKDLVAGSGFRFED